MAVWTICPTSAEQQDMHAVGGPGSVSTRDDRHQLDEMLSKWKRASGSEQANIGVDLSKVGHKYIGEGEAERARSLFERMLAICEERYGSTENSAHLAVEGEICLLDGKTADAADRYRRASDLYVKDDPRLLFEDPYNGRYMECLYVLGRTKEINTRASRTHSYWWLLRGMFSVSRLFTAHDWRLNVCFVLKALAAAVLLRKVLDVSMVRAASLAAASCVVSWFALIMGSTSVRKKCVDGLLYSSVYLYKQPFHELFWCALGQAMASIVLVPMVEYVVLSLLCWRRLRAAVFGWLLLLNLGTLVAVNLVTYAHMLATMR